MSRELSPRDLITIGTWARTTWHVAWSLPAGAQVYRPALSGGSGIRLPAAADSWRGIFPDRAWYEMDHSSLRIYRPTGAGRQTLHRITWTVVDVWLRRWSGRDAEALVAMNRRRARLENTPSELAVPCWDPAYEEVCRRRRARLDGGDLARIGEVDRRMTAMVDDYLYGGRSPAVQLGLF